MGVADGSIEMPKGRPWAPLMGRRGRYDAVDERATLGRLHPAAIQEETHVPDDDAVILQRLVDALYRDHARVTRLDVIVRAEAMDLPPELLGLIDLLPPGTYPRQALCDQLNSALKGHGWTGRYGTVE